VLVSSWQQAVTLLLAVIPGFIYQGTRARLRGPTPDEQENIVRILRALATSGFLALLYVAILGGHLTDAATDPRYFTENPPDRRLTAIALIGLVFAVPMVFAFIVHYCKAHFVISGLRIERTNERFSVYDPTATAWDFAADHMGRGFVRVYTSDDTWVGGRSEERSYFSGYPETREIYLQEAWELDEDGVFKRPIPGTAGVWIPCDDAQFVQFLTPGEVTNDSQSSKPGDPEGGGYAEGRVVASLPLGKGRKLCISVTHGS
jgi:hypothetical protein